MDINKAFHLYDIRGEYPGVVDEQLASIVSSAVIKFLKAKKIAVAWDNRDSSEKLVQALTYSIDTVAACPIKYGQIPTPVFYYGVIKDDCDAGIMVTASHLGTSQNGLKIVKKGALPLSQGELIELKKLCSDVIHGTINESPTLRRTATENINDRYLAEIVSRFQVTSLFSGKIIVDTGKTILTPIVDKIFSALKLDNKIITPDHGPNPLLEENRKILSEIVIKEKAELGIIFDGDGDRCLFVDSQGKLIPPTFILGILAKDHKKAVFDVRAGRSAYTTDFEIIPSWAQEIKFAMADNPEIAFGGETSGHLVFKEWYTIDDGIFGALKFLETIADKNLDDILITLRAKYVESPEINYDIDFDPTAALEKIAEYYRKKGEDVSIMDGVTVTGADYKINIRPSLTEALVRLNVESSNEAQTQNLIHEINHLLTYEPARKNTK